jgi:hypothetical protein
MRTELLLSAAGIAAIGAFGSGWFVRDLIADRSEARSAARLAESHVVAQRALDRQSRAFETERRTLGALRPQSRTLINEAYHDIPVPSDCAVRPDVLRLLEDARARANAAAAGQSGKPVHGGPAGTADRPGESHLGG